MDKLINISQAAKILGVSASTLRRWEKEKKLIPVRTQGLQRRYEISQLRPHQKRNFQQEKRTIAYARVSSHDQKKDLERQKETLELYPTEMKMRNFSIPSCVAFKTFLIQKC